MYDKRHNFPRELSGGEPQRVSIARAIVKNPKLLLCDEPTGALDLQTSRSILKLLQQVNTNFGTTILMITHNTAIAAMANRVFKLRSGEIVDESNRRLNRQAVELREHLWAKGFTVSNWIDIMNNKRARIVL
jgi:putative ABC transport system ATP-binding protein